jgi:LPS O-antigen subunit length determinant protein (WzzB/FepE family)
MQIEIEQLSMRLAEAEAKLKTEVARIKKKMQIQITELEMSLDAANKHNIDLQKTIKRQGQQIIVSQSINGRNALNPRHFKLLFCCQSY